MLFKDLISSTVLIVDAAENHTGLGFVVSNGGLILTTVHVVMCFSSYELGIIFSGGLRARADIQHIFSDNDITLLRIHDKLSCGVVSVELGYASKTIGHAVTIIGAEKRSHNLCSFMYIKCDIAGQLNLSKSHLLQLRPFSDNNSVI
jgi:hypothetical protein